MQQIRRVSEVIPVRMKLCGKTCGDTTSRHFKASWKERTWLICYLTCTELKVSVWGQQNEERCFLISGRSINTQRWHWQQRSLLSHKYCSAEEDKWRSWPVTGSGKVGGRRERRGVNRRGNLPAFVTQAGGEGGGIDVWHPASGAVENSGSD